MGTIDNMIMCGLSDPTTCKSSLSMNLSSNLPLDFALRQPQPLDQLLMPPKPLAGVALPVRTTWGVAALISQRHSLTYPLLEDGVTNLFHGHDDVVPLRIVHEHWHVQGAKFSNTVERDLSELPQYGKPKFPRASIRWGLSNDGFTYNCLHMPHGDAARSNVHRSETTVKIMWQSQTHLEGQCWWRRPGP